MSLIKLILYNNLCCTSIVFPATTLNKCINFWLVGLGPGLFSWAECSVLRLTSIKTETEPSTSILENQERKPDWTFRFRFGSIQSSVLGFSCPGHPPPHSLSGVRFPIRSPAPLPPTAPPWTKSSAR